MTALPESPSAERHLDASSLRMRALERLYQRRTAIDNLIDALERYRERGSEDPGVETIAGSK